MFKSFLKLVFACSVFFITTGTVSANANDRIARSVKVTDDGISKTYITSENTVGDFLEKENIVLYERDEINVELTDEFGSIYSSANIEIKRGYYINVIIDGKEEKVKVGPKYAVGNLIATMKREMKKDFYYDGPLSDEITRDSIIVLSSKREEKMINKEPIPHEIETIHDDSLEEGLEEIVTVGVNGEREIEVIVFFEGGNEVSREVVSEKITKEPINHVVKKGTAKIAETEKASFKYVKEYIMEATAYTAGYESTGKRPGMKGYGMTATGMKVDHGVVAVDPKIIPLGTELYIEGYGYAVAADTGASIKNYKIDLFFHNVSEALRFGRRNIKVYVLSQE